MELGLLQDDVGSPAEADDILRSLLADDISDAPGLIFDNSLAEAGDHGHATGAPVSAVPGAASVTGAFDGLLPNLWQLGTAVGPPAPQAQPLPEPLQQQALLHPTQTQADEVQRRHADVMAWLAASEGMGGIAVSPEVLSFPQAQPGIGLLMGGMQGASAAQYGGGMAGSGLGAGLPERRISNTSAGAMAAAGAVHPHPQQLLVPAALSPTAAAVTHGGIARVSAGSASLAPASVEPMLTSHLTAAARPSLSFSGHAPQQLMQGMLLPPHQMAAAAQQQQQQQQQHVLLVQQQAALQGQPSTMSAGMAAGLMPPVMPQAVAAAVVGNSTSGGTGVPQQHMQAGSAMGAAPGAQDDRLFAEIEAMPFPRYAQYCAATRGHFACGDTTCVNLFA